MTFKKLSFGPNSEPLLDGEIITSHITGYSLDHDIKRDGRHVAYLTIRVLVQPPDDEVEPDE